MSFKRNVVVIIGVGRMGLAIARRLGSGCHLVLADSSSVPLEAAAGTLRGEGHFIEAVHTDVSSLRSVLNLAKHAGTFGPIRIIAYTASLSPMQAPPGRIDPVYLLGPAYVIEAFLPFASTGTSLVVISSLAGHIAKANLSPEFEKHLATAPVNELLNHAFFNTPIDERVNAPGLPAYGISERASFLRVQASAAAWGKKGARINSISTPTGHQELEGRYGEYMRGMLANGPAGRMGTDVDIANAVSFLGSPEASFITGTDILLDGGWLASQTWKE
ncbi:hypothetical protein BJX99DRAFT_237635 [Aspergillus californicus]